MKAARILAATLTALVVTASLPAGAHAPKAASGEKRMQTVIDVTSVAPALEKYTRERLFGELWQRPGLSPRDRSIVTLAVVIAHNQTIEMRHYVTVTFDHSVKPREFPKLLSRLAFYGAWP